MTPPPPSCPMHMHMHMHMHRPPPRSGLQINSSNVEQWWPEQYLDLSVLRCNGEFRNQHLQEERDYSRRFATLDLAALERDLRTLMTTSVDWWPADYGHYGPFFIRYVH